MTDHGLTFKDFEIQALLREAKEPGTGKTQTRRIAKGAGQKVWQAPHTLSDGLIWMTDHPDGGATTLPMRIQPGDRVWCRETWTHTGQGVWSIENARMSGRGGVRYRADHEILGARYFPSIFLPREFSRLTLYVSEVRVQRLQDISEADADAECFAGDFPTNVLPDLFPGSAEDWGHLTMSQCYARLWEHINGPGSWAENPWVAAYTFVPRLGNIDTLPSTLEAA